MDDGTRSFNGFDGLGSVVLIVCGIGGQLAAAHQPYLRPFG